MKNGITLLIASFLLALCILQKEARYGTATQGSVEKTYSSSPMSAKRGTISETPYSEELLTDSQTFEFVSADTTSNSQPASRLANQRLLQISANSKMLNY
ncbi:MAG: hypothetical protein ACO1N1_21600 [Dyadobacter fermentans]